MDKQLRDITVGEWKAICDQRTQARNSGDSEYACPGCPMNSVCAATPDEWELPEDTPTAGDDTPTEGAKPRLAEVLGVDMNERFHIKNTERDIWVDKDGDICTSGEGKIDPFDILDAINHPESIIHAPRLTEAELERCRVYGAKWAYRSTGGQQPVFLCKAKPILYKHDFPVDDGDAKDIIASIWDETMFPSVKPGDCICVEEACRDE